MYRVRRAGMSIDLALSKKPDNNISITYRGHTFKNAEALCSHFGANVISFRDRRSHGWSVAESLGHKARDNRGKGIIFQGKKYKDTSSLCKAFNIDRNTFASRKRRGWSTAESLGQKKREYQRGDDCQGKVYRILNRITGETYVGVTIQPIRARMQQHKAGSHCLRLWQDMRTHGFKNFSYRILYRTDSRQDLLEKEKQFIQQFDSVVKGYNTLSGASGAAGTTGKPFKFRGVYYSSLREFSERFEISYGVVKYRVKAGYKIADIAKLSSISVP